MNLMESVNMQNSYLCGLISVIPIQQRRPRKDKAEAWFNNESYKYRVHCSIKNVWKYFKHMQCGKDKHDVWIVQINSVLITEI